MKITHNKVGQNLNTSDAAKSDKTKGAGKASGESAASMLDTSDKSSAGPTRVNLSQRARDIQRAKEVATSAPDIDEAKVAKFQKLIDEGKYNVSAEDIADKMVDEHLNFPM